MIDAANHPSEAAEKVLDLFGNDILRFAYSYLKNREDAEDIVQETLIRLLRAKPCFDDEEKAKSWLLRVAANLCRDELGRAEKKRVVAFPEGYEVPAERKPERDGDDKLLQALMQLPEQYRTVIHMYYYEEYSTREIARITGRKEATVRSLLKRGREKLKKGRLDL